MYYLYRWYEEWTPLCCDVRHLHWKHAIFESSLCWYWWSSLHTSIENHCQYLYVGEQPLPSTAVHIPFCFHSRNLVLTCSDFWPNSDDSALQQDFMSWWNAKKGLESLNIQLLCKTTAVYIYIVCTWRPVDCLAMKPSRLYKYCCIL